jgi:hypothetical protein
MTRDHKHHTKELLTIDVQPWDSVNEEAERPSQLR